MKLKQITHRLNTFEAMVESLEQRQFWLRCLRQYTVQPIYKTDGKLMAVELLTMITHPDDARVRIPPERYFSSISVPHRLLIIEEQLRCLLSRESLFLQHGILASINIDGPTLMAMKQYVAMIGLIDRLPWVRFELVEHIMLPAAESLARTKEFGPLWLDDFGTGMANFSVLSEVRYDYIKLARELFIMLRQSESGRDLFPALVQLMNGYCQGVIVEGVETRDEWLDIQASSACAAQGYYFSRPVPVAHLESLFAVREL